MSRTETTYSIQCREASETCTLEQRKNFVSLMHKGETLGIAAEKVGMSFDAALGTMNANIMHIRVLKKPEDVK